MASFKKQLNKVDLKLPKEKKRRKSDLVMVWQSMMNLIEFVFLKLWKYFSSQVIIKDFCSKTDEQKELQNWLAKYFDSVPADFSYSWRDGVLLCKLLNQIKPGCYPTIGKLKPDFPVKNVSEALYTIETHFNIDLKVTVEEIVTCSDNSNLKLFYLLMELKKETENSINITQPSQTGQTEETKTIVISENKRCVSKGTGLIVGFVGREANFVVCYPELTDLDLVIDIKGPSENACSERITDRSPKRKIILKEGNPNMSYLAVEENLTASGNVNDLQLGYEIHPSQVNFSYIPRAKGQHVVAILCKGSHVSNSPYIVTVEPTLGIYKSDSTKSREGRTDSKTDIKPKKDADVGRFGKVVTRRVLRYIVRVENRDIVVNTESIGNLATELLKMDYETQKCPLSRRNSWGFVGDAERKVSMIRQFCVDVDKLEAQSLRVNRSHSLTINPKRKKTLLRSNSFEYEDITRQNRLETVKEGSISEVFVSKQDEELEYTYMNNKFGLPTEGSESVTEKPQKNEVSPKPEKINRYAKSFKFNYESIDHSIADFLENHFSKNFDVPQRFKKDTCKSLNNKDVMNCSNTASSSRNDSESHSSSDALRANPVKEEDNILTTTKFIPIQTPEQIDEDLIAYEQPIQNSNDEFYDVSKMNVSPQETKCSLSQENCFSDDNTLPQFSSNQSEREKKNAFKMQESLDDNTIRLSSTESISQNSQAETLTAKKRSDFKSRARAYQKLDSKDDFSMINNRKNGVLKLVNSYNSLTETGNETEDFKKTETTFGETQIFKAPCEQEEKKELTNQEEVLLSSKTKLKSCEANFTRSNIYRSYISILLRNKSGVRYKREVKPSAKNVTNSIHESLRRSENVILSGKAEVTERNCEFHSKQNQKSNTENSGSISENQKTLMSLGNIEIDHYNFFLQKIKNSPVKKRINQWENYYINQENSDLKIKDNIVESSSIKSKLNFWENVCRSDNIFSTKKDAVSLSSSNNNSNIFKSCMERRIKPQSHQSPENKDTNISGQTLTTLSAKREVDGREINQEDNSLRPKLNQSKLPYHNATQRQRCVSDPGNYPHVPLPIFNSLTRREGGQGYLRKDDTTDHISPGTEKMIGYESLYIGDTFPIKWQNEDETDLGSLDGYEDPFGSTEDEYIDDEISESASTFWGDISVFREMKLSDMSAYEEIHHLANHGYFENFLPEGKSSAFECKAYGIATYFGYVAVKNTFMVLTKGAGCGNLTATVQGRGQHDVAMVSVRYLHRDLYEVTYQVMTPGLYLISVRWMENPIFGSPFPCKVTY